MKYALAFLLLIVTTAQADNPIDKGSMRIAGGISFTKETSEWDEVTYRTTLYPDFDVFVNSNFGIGIDAFVNYSHLEDYESWMLHFTPTIIYVTEKPQWPLYISLGPNFFRRTSSWNEEVIKGWQAEGGVFMFINDNFVISPLLRYTKNLDDFRLEELAFQVKIGYFFHRKETSP